jgi:hypothetical protein
MPRRRSVAFVILGLVLFAFGHTMCLSDESPIVLSLSCDGPLWKLTEGLPILVGLLCQVQDHSDPIPRELSIDSMWSSIDRARASQPTNKSSLSCVGRVYRGNWFESGRPLEAGGVETTRPRPEHNW